MVFIHALILQLSRSHVVFIHTLILQLSRSHEVFIHALILQLSRSNEVCSLVCCLFLLVLNKNLQTNQPSCCAIAVIVVPIVVFAFVVIVL